MLRGARWVSSSGVARFSWEAAYSIIAVAILGEVRGEEGARTLSISRSRPQNVRCRFISFDSPESWQSCRGGGSKVAVKQK